MKHLFILVLLVLASAATLHATDYYWSPTTGNWGTVGNWKIGSFTGTTATSLPTAADNIFIGNGSANATITLNISDTVGNLTIQGSGQIFINTSNASVLNVLGDLTSTNTNATGGGSAVVRLNGTGSQTLAGNASGTVGVGKLPNLTVDKSGSTLSLTGIVSLGGSTTLKYVAGTISAGTSKVYCYYNNTFDGSFSFYDLEFNGNASNTFLLADLTVSHNLYLSGSSTTYLRDHTINLAGDLINTDAYSTGCRGGNTVVNLNGSTDQTIRNATSTGLTASWCPAIKFSKSSGTVYLRGNIVSSFPWTNNYSSTAINSDSATVVFYNYINQYGTQPTISGTQTLTLKRVVFDSNGPSLITTLSGTATPTLSITDTIWVKGGSNQIRFFGGTMELYGCAKFSSTYTGIYPGSQATWLTLKGSADQTVWGNAANKACGFPNLIVNKTGGTVYFKDHVPACNFTYTAGTLDFTTYQSTFEPHGDNIYAKTSGGTQAVFYNCFINTSGSNGIALGSPIVVAGDFTIDAGSTLFTTSNSYAVTFKGNATVNGTLNPYNSTFTFSGTGNQTLGGTATSFAWNTLTVNKASGTLTISRPLTLGTSLTLTSGIVNTDATNLIILNNGATVTGGSNTSFVAGPLKKIGNAAFTFPVGKGSYYNPLYISAPSSTTDAFTAEYFNSAYNQTNLDTSLTYASNCAYWNLNHTTGSSNVKVRLYWNSTSCDIYMLSTLKIALYGTSNWKSIGSTITSGNVLNGYIESSATQSSFGKFTIGKNHETPTNCGEEATLAYWQNQTGGMDNFNQSNDLSDHMINDVLPGNDQSFNPKPHSRSGCTPTYVIPTVFYIIDNGVTATPDLYNMSYGQVTSALNALNILYAPHNITFCIPQYYADQSQTLLPYTNSSQPGIFRIHNSSLTNLTYTTDQANFYANQVPALNNLSPSLPSPNYLRIFIVNDVGGDGLGGVVGLGAFPNAIPGFDCVIIDYRMFGTANCSGCPTGIPWNDHDQGKILVHEVGHYLNLYHISTNGCSAPGDYVPDTDPVNSNYANLGHSFNCTPDNSVFCLSNPQNSPNYSNTYLNYMQWVDDPCISIFSPGQDQRMIACLNSSRWDLCSPTNLYNTGVACTNNVAIFSITSHLVCLGQSISMVAGTYPSGTTFSWDYGDGSTGTGSSVSHTYATTGQYTITFTVNQNGITTCYNTDVVVTTCGNNVNCATGHWYFGHHAGLTFQGGALPIPDYSALTNNTIFTEEGTTSISDDNCNLLFYSDGVNVWNNLHQQINTTVLTGNISTSQTLALKNPQNSNQYFLFTMPVGSGTSTYGAYSTVNISATTASMGTYNTALPLPTGVSLLGEAITAVPFCDGTGYWVFTLASPTATGQSELVIYKLTSSGVGSAPITFSLTGMVTNATTPNYGVTMKVSPDGKTLAISHIETPGINSHFVLLTISQSSTAITLTPLAAIQNTAFAYGMSFSPNSKFLYVGDYYDDEIYQYDVTASTISATQFLVGSTASNSVQGIQLGPDGKIYCTSDDPNFMSVINFPDLSGNACGFSYHSINLNASVPVGYTISTGYIAASIPSYADAIASTDNATFGYDRTACLSFNFFTASCQSVSWNFGDPSSGSNNSSTLQNPSHTFTAPGTYTVSLTFGTAPTITQSVTVGITLSAIAGPYTIDACTPLLLGSYSASPNPSTNISYSWVFTDANNSTYSYSTPTVDFNWHNQIGYRSVTLTVTDNFGCSATTSMTVIVQDCCTPVPQSPTENDLKFDNSVSSMSNTSFVSAMVTYFASSYGSGLGSAGSGVVTFNPGLAPVILFDRDLIITTGTSLTLNNCNIRFTQGHGIIAYGNITLNATTIDACNQMWNGIASGPQDSPITIDVVNGSFIKHALTGVAIKEYPILNVHDSYFISDYVGIKMENYIGNSSAAISIYGTTFDFDPVTGFNGWQPTSGNYVLLRGTHIIVTNNNTGPTTLLDLITIGDNTQPPNNFLNFSTGLSAANANLKIINNNFVGGAANEDPFVKKLRTAIDCSGANFNNYAIGEQTTSGFSNTISHVGYGIKLTTSFNTVIRNNQITDAYRGVKILKDFSATIDANTFNGTFNSPYFDVGTAIDAQQCSYSTSPMRALNITGNTFTGVANGIRIFRYVRTGIAITGNHINVGGTVNYTNGFGIAISSPVAASTSWKPDGNTIPTINANEIEHMGTGINLNRALHATVTNNRIIYVAGAYKYGIRATNVFGLSVTNQNASNAYVWSNVPIATGSTTGQPASTIPTNTFGISAEGCNQFTICNNDVERSQFGITVSGANTAATFASAVTSNNMNYNNNGFNLASSAALVNQGYTGHPSDDRWLPTSGWYDGVVNFHTYSTSSAGISLTFYGLTGILGRVNSINGGQYPISGLTTATGCNPCSCLSGANVSAISDINSSRAASKLIVNGTGYESPTRAYAARFALYKQLTDEGADSLLVDTAIAYFVDTAATGTIGRLAAVDEAIGAMARDSSVRNLSDAVDSNAAIVPDNDVAYVLKTVNAIYLNTLLAGTDTFTAAQLATLWGIAPACPSDRGPGVYMARALLSLAVDSMVDYPDTCTVDSSGLRRAEQAQRVPQTALLLAHPNPASTTVYIEFVNPFNHAAATDLSVTDALGKTVYSVRLADASGTVTLKTSTLAAGVYFVKWIDNGSASHQTKFVVTH